MTNRLPCDRSLPDTPGGRIAFWHGGDTRPELAAAIDRALAEAWQSGYDAGDHDAEALHMLSVSGSQTPLVATENPFAAPADGPLRHGTKNAYDDLECRCGPCRQVHALASAQDRWAERFTNPDLWR
jgi:hypothetical protein